MALLHSTITVYNTLQCTIHDSWSPLLPEQYKSLQRENVKPEQKGVSRVSVPNFAAVRNMMKGL